MTVLNVEYFNSFSILHESVQFFIVLVILIAIVITLSLLICGFEDHDKKCTKCGLFLLVIIFFVFICIAKAHTTETDYISKKYVKIEDDSIPLEVFEDWEIEDVKGDIYILAPRDGKKIKDEEKATNENGS
jgi:hypothetical protein